MSSTAENKIYLFRDKNLIRTTGSLFRDMQNSTVSIGSLTPFDTWLEEDIDTSSKFHMLLRAHAIECYRNRGSLTLIASTTPNVWDNLCLSASVCRNFIKDLDTLSFLHNDDKLSKSSIKNLRIIVEGKVDLFIQEKTNEKDENGDALLTKHVACSKQFHNKFSTDYRKTHPSWYTQSLWNIPPRALLQANPTQSVELSISAYIEWNEFDQNEPLIDSSSTKNSFLQSLFENEDSKDFKIVAENGAEVKCHKLVLSARSEFFQAMLNSTEMKESQTGMVELKGLSEEGLKYFVKYLYGIQIPPSALTPELVLEFMQTGHAYGSPKLVEEMSTFLLGKDDKFFINNKETLFELYFFTKLEKKFEKVENHLLKIMERMPSEEIRTNQKFKELSKEEAFDLLFKMLGLRNANL